MTDEWHTCSFGRYIQVCWAWYWGFSLGFDIRFSTRHVELYLGWFNIRIGA